MNLATFWKNEDGQLTIDWTVLVAAIMGVGLIVGAEVATGVEKVTDGYDGINSGEGMMTMFVSSPNAPTRTAADTQETAEAQETAEPIDETQACNAANPGNDKCVGNAGETPNGDEDAWGDGSNGQGDVKGGRKRR